MNKIFFFILLILIGCSKDDIVENPIQPPVVTLTNPYEGLTNGDISLDFYGNKLPDLFRNTNSLMLGIEYPSDKVIFDYNNDGHMDFIHSDSDYMSSYEGVIVRNYITFYLGDESGKLYLDNKNNNKYLGLIHGKKGIVSDVNGDGFLDVFFAGLGLENGNPRFEYPIALINNQNGEFIEHRLTDLVGYWHSVTSSDIDNDGKSEIILVSPNERESLILDYEDGFIPTIFNIPREYSDGKFSQESIDINNDGYADIILGSDYEDNPSFPELKLEKSIVYLNSPNGFNDEIIKLPLNDKAKSYTSVLDINFYDLDNDSYLDIIISRTEDYNRSYIQVLKNNITSFEDVTDLYIDNNTFEFEGGAIEWLYVGDFNSDGIVDLRTNINNGEFLKWELINNKFILK